MVCVCVWCVRMFFLVGLSCDVKDMYRCDVAMFSSLRDFRERGRDWGALNGKGQENKSGEHLAGGKGWGGGWFCLVIHWHARMGRRETRYGYHSHDGKAIQYEQQNAK